MFPLSWVYALISGLRNWLFDRGIFKQTSFDIPVISVGNLIVGGTGKTPLTVYLIKHFNLQRKRVAVLSRGYKRKTSGFRIADDDTGYKEIGDEALQVYRKFKDQVIVAVDENRVHGIKCLIQEFKSIDIILLDDAFQHRWVNPQLNILLTTFAKPFFNDHVIPSGWLRESRNAAKRADLIIVTKSPATLDYKAKKSIGTHLDRYKCTGVPVLFSNLKYQPPQPIEERTMEVCKDVILITGISNAFHLVNDISSKYNVIRHHEFSDHHDYKISDINSIVQKNDAAKKVSYLTTEKDMVKLERFKSRFKGTLFIISVEMAFDDSDTEILNEAMNF